jgi:hypothetical protein
LKIARLIIIFALLQFSTSAQEVLLKIPTEGKRISAFIPRDYKLKDSVSGDLNKDGLKDFVLVLNHQQEDTFEMNEEPKRILLVLFKSNTGFKVAGKSDEVLMCRHCGGMYGDPFAAIDIAKGVLSIEHYGGRSWRWTETRKFRYQGNFMLLIGSTSDYFSITNDCNGNGIGESGRNYKDINYVTGDEEVIEKDEECKLIKHTKKKQPKKPLVKLEEFKYDF